MMFKKPASASGRLNWGDLNGSLVLAYAKGIETNVQTSVGERDCVVSDVHVLDGAQQGRVYRNAYVFPVVLQDQLRDEIGDEPILGRVGQGTAKRGQSAPWLLEEADAKGEKIATAYLDSLGNGNGHVESDDDVF
jgi:hypothetical protein